MRAEGATRGRQAAGMACAPGAVNYGGVTQSGQDPRPARHCLRTRPGPRRLYAAGHRPGACRAAVAWRWCQRAGLAGTARAYDGGAGRDCRGAGLAIRRAGRRACPVARLAQLHPAARSRSTTSTSPPTASCTRRTAAAAGSTFSSSRACPELAMPDGYQKQRMRFASRPARARACESCRPLGAVEQWELPQGDQPGRDQRGPRADPGTVTRRTVTCELTETVHTRTEWLPVAPE